MEISREIVGSINENDVLLYELKNDNGTTIKITNIGATITSISTPDKDGKIGEIVLGFDDPTKYLDPQYLADSFFFGATVGRYANRIKGGKFSIDGKEYNLEVNNGPNHLHGGTNSFNTKFWTSELFAGSTRVGVKMSYISENGDNGYPGTLSVSVVFSLSNDNELTIDYHASTDKKTVLNLTNHSYFNLKGDGNVFDTLVQMEADRYTPKDETNIPYGDIESVKDTALDFTFQRKIGDRIHMFDDGYDHNYVINGVYGELRKAAEAYEPESGRTLQFFTTEPGFQFYTAYYLNGRYSRNGFKFDQFAGFCFEAQHYPDSPNKPEFPTTMLKPGEVYSQTTVYKFGTKK